uniref:Dam family site-specific DNA-(adenine-N6)-methyltransferase n=1 Tax=Clostridium sp. 12(A) TaxID=1163671 RepID=UPI0004BB0AB4|nr:Dam family site-specific DNA-(adenine-N6)-methyltransferase [Clostridium sp. 12(A)]
MEYITIKEVADKWGLSVRRVQTLCNENKITGAVRFGKAWAIPKEVEKPVDHRIKSGVYVKEKVDINVNRETEGFTTPILKWAGGKTQMLGDIVQRMPRNYERYVEPFIGGGALFFYLGAKNSLIADSNPELINLYKQVAENCEKVINALKKYRNEEEMFYEVRSKDWKDINPIDAAARMIFLNRTCFNGLYRLNKKGYFNTPFGKYENPNICNEEKIRKASKLLKNTAIICGDYLQVLDKYVNKGDFVFLDPPYVPISENSDFKRYTKEQFYEEDQRKLAKKVEELVDKGCYVMLTNSNHPLVHELYGNYNIEIIPTRRNINSRGDKRRGEDIIVRTYTK